MRSNAGAKLYAAKKRTEAAAQWLEENENAARKPDKKASQVSIPVLKVTEAKLRRQREEEQAKLQRKAEEVKTRQRNSNFNHFSGCKSL